MSMNLVVLMGNLTRQPEVRYTPNQTAICKGGLAINRKYKKGDQWVEGVTFVDFTIFGARGEAFEKFHAKGDVALLEGELRLDQWDDKQTGEKRSKLYVVVSNWEFAGGKKEGGGGKQGGGSMYEHEDTVAADQRRDAEDGYPA